MKKTRQVFLVALNTSLTLPTIAEEQSPIIVTATRTAQTADESLASVTVITAEQIQQQQPNDLRDLLTSIAGIDMTNNGGIGKTTSLFMRGTSSSHLLVMIDGIEIGSATLGTSALQHIPVSQIERIEIVRGPRAALYGSKAIGGVIHIFTSKAKELANIEMSYGTYNTSKISAGISTKNDKTSFSLNASHLKTNGFDAVNDAETDDDGYVNDSVTLNTAHEFSKTSSLNFNFMHADGLVDYDGTFQNNSAFVQQTAGLKYNFNATKSWNVVLAASQSLDENENFLNATYTSTFNTKRDNVSWQNDINIGLSQLLTMGIDYQNDAITSSSSYNATERSNNAIFIQHQWSGESNDAQIAVRNNDYEDFGSHATGSLAFGHQFENDLKLITSYGTAFKAPTFNELYLLDFGYGNPNLKPEESESFEIELRNTHAWGKWNLNFYQTNIANLIAGFPANNVNEAQINGVEFRLNTKIADWDTSLDLSFLDPRDKTTDKILQRRSQQSLRLNMDKAWGKWKNGISLIAQGYRYNDTANNVRIPGYAIVNLQSQYQISKKFTLKGKIENLFDKDYATALDFSNNQYNNPGISMFISLQYQDF